MIKRTAVNRRAVIVDQKYDHKNGNLVNAIKFLVFATPNISINISDFETTGNTTLIIKNPRLNGILENCEAIDANGDIYQKQLQIIIPNNDSLFKHDNESSFNYGYFGPLLKFNELKELYINALIPRYPFNANFYIDHNSKIYIPYYQMNSIIELCKSLNIIHEKFLTNN